MLGGITEGDVTSVSLVGHLETRNYQKDTHNIVFLIGPRYGKRGLFWGSSGLLSPRPLQSVVAGIMTSSFSEFIVDLFQRRRRRANATIRDSVEAGLIRLSLDFGRVISTLYRIRCRGFFEHFDFFCSGQHIRYERRIAATKALIALVVMLLVAVWIDWKEFPY
jgi:hypothetical protein